MRTEKELAEKIQELLKRGKVLIDEGDLSSIKGTRAMNDALKEINGKIEALMWVQEMLGDL